MFDFVDETLDQMALAVEMRIVETVLFSVPAGQNHRDRPKGINQGNQVVGIITLIGDDEVTDGIGESRRSLSDIMDLPASEAEVQGQAQCSNLDMDLGAQPTPAAA